MNIKAFTRGLGLAVLIAGAPISGAMAAKAAAAKSAMFAGGPERLGRSASSRLAFVTGEAWSLQTGGSIRSTPLAYRGLVYAGSDDGVFYAVDERTGRLRWKADMGAPVGGSAVGADGVVYVSSNDNRLMAFEARSGKVRWRRELGANLPHRGFWDFFAATPAVVDGVLYTGSGDGHVYALDAASGREIWRFAIKGRVRSSPAVVGDAVVIGGYDGRVYRLDRATGREVWRFDTEGVGFDFDKFGFDRTSVQASPSVQGESVVVGGRDGRLYGLEFATGKQRWKIRYGAPWVVSSALLTDGRAIVGSSDGEFVTGVEIATGKELWRTKVGDNVLSSLVLVDGLVLFNCEDGKLYALDPVTGVVAWTLTLGGKSFGSPALGQGLVLTASNAGRLQAFHARSRARSEGRAVYFESEPGFHNWDPKHFVAARDRLKAAGYREVGHDGLEAFLRAQIASGRPGVLVMLGERLPKAVIDRAAGPTLYRRFLEAGGRIVAPDGWPGGLVLNDKGEPDFDPKGPGAQTGVGVEDQSFDETRAVPTDAGRARGLKSWTMSAYGARISAVDVVLAMGDDGYAAAWEKRVGRGAFIRAPAAQNQEPDADMLLAVAEHAAERK